MCLCGLNTMNKPILKLGFSDTFENCKLFLHIWGICRRVSDKILAGFQFLIAEIQPLYQKFSFSRLFHRLWRILWLCLIKKNKTDVGPSDIVIQLIKAHSLHTLFAIFEKKCQIKKKPDVNGNKMVIIGKKITVSQRWKIEIQPKFYLTLFCVSPICAKIIGNFQ